MGVIPDAQIKANKTPRSAEMAQQDKSNRNGPHPVKGRQMVGLHGFALRRKRFSASRYAQIVLYLNAAR
jgi:hypothetical protein